MNVFIAPSITRAVEPTTRQGSSGRQGLLQQDDRRKNSQNEDFATVLARLSSRSA